MCQDIADRIDHHSKDRAAAIVAMIKSGNRQPSEGLLRDRQAEADGAS